MTVNLHCFALVLAFNFIAFGSCRPQLQGPRLQHIAVIKNAAWEQNLPNDFLNPFYKSPRVREALAKSSWFGPGEHVVYERQAEKIPRMEIYNVLTHAGLIPRGHLH